MINNYDFLRLRPDYSLYPNTIHYYTTRQKLVEFLYPNLSVCLLQKILRKMKKINIYENNEFKSLFELIECQGSTCAKFCPYEYGYCHSILYSKKIIIINHDDIPYFKKIILDKEVFDKDRHLLVHKEVFEKFKNTIPYTKISV